MTGKDLLMNVKKGLRYFCDDNLEAETTERRKTEIRNFYLNNLETYRMNEESFDFETADKIWKTLLKLRDIANIRYGVWF